MTAIDGALADMPDDGKRRFAKIFAEELLRRQPHAEERLAEDLAGLGWSYVDRTLLPVQILDPSDLASVPAESRADLLKASQRLRDGDLGGALSAACAAVDSATNLVYAQANLGDPSVVSFQERCVRAAQAAGVLPDLERELKTLGWQESDVTPLKKNLAGAINHAAFVMQSLRSRMSDVHGTKPVLKSLVFDCLKWAEFIVGSLVRGRADA